MKKKTKKLIIIFALITVVLGVLAYFLLSESPLEQLVEDSIERIADGEKLMLIEQLTYLDEEVAQAAGVEYVRADDSYDVAEFLQNFDDEALNRLEQTGDIIDKYGINTYIQGSEWAAVIRAIESDAEIMNLKISDCDIYEDRTRAICFHDFFLSENAIVAFRGTTSADEWIDNAAGFNLADTDCQIQALDYIEGLSYDNIYVVGHSKGGNKAQYVTLRSDKVRYCVSMDGQGFSKEFTEKYTEEIREKGNLITCYSLYDDYIHELLFTVSGSMHTYCKGSGVKSFTERHSPNSFFQFEKQKSSTFIKCNDEGEPLLVIRKEKKGISKLHELSCYMAEVMPAHDKISFAEYLRKIVAVKYGGKTLKVGGKSYSENNVLDFAFCDMKNCPVLIAYLISYVNSYNVTDAELYEILYAMGLDDVVEAIKSVLKNDIARALKGKLWAKMSEALSDDKDDKYCRLVLSEIVGRMSADVNGKKLWDSMEDAYKKIPLS